ncbi:MAG: fused MFS/spermidine synthase [Labilithrix sp.]
MRPHPLTRVATFLFFSGACALVYQVAWFRELRLVFGGSTSASSAVLAVFMAGLGAGGFYFGRRVDRAASALSVYAHLELAVSVLAAASPLLVTLARMVYVGLGGVATLGVGGATVVRLLLTLLVLGPPTFAMGGTMPAAARAVERASSAGRQRVGLLYGVNTIGAVAGTVAANFLLLEVFGTRMTLWLVCLVNALVGVIARAVARRTTEDATEAADADDVETAPAPDEASAAPWFPPVAAGASGLAFMVMELVWYRMLAPLLGGTTYTFGLILAVALAGIGLGGALYSRRRRPATLPLFALTCLLEALAIAIPFALGDRIAVLALLLSPLAHSSFVAGVATWAVITSIVVLPAAVISGFQFPAVIGLYGRGKKDVGSHVGRAYLANTIGSIAGAIAAGFGLLPLLGAVRCWTLVVVLLVVIGVVALVADGRRDWRAARGALAASAAVAAAALAALTARGPTAAWRHSGIGAGRADLSEGSDRRAIAQFLARWRSGIAWDADGVESGVALHWQNGYSFIVNGKSDGEVYADRATQVMSGLLGALIHGQPKRALVVGLGTGSSAGWLGRVPSIERVDVMELESVILRVAKDCAKVNEDVLQNPKVHIQLNDAREGLLTSRQRYDLVFSEPSNPYRAGISSLYTVEYYRAVAARLADDGVFAQWIQAYDVDPFAVGTAMTTIHAVFPHITVWRTTNGDLLLIGQKVARPFQFDQMRALLATEPFASATLAAWETSSLEGVLAHFVGDSAFVDRVVASQAGAVNEDDQNLLEFAFARNVGTRATMDRDIARVAHRLHHDMPQGTGAFDTSLILEEVLLNRGSGILAQLGESRLSPELALYVAALSAFEREEWPDALLAWDKLGRKQPRTAREASYLARAMAEIGDRRFPTVVPEVKRAAEREFLNALWLLRLRKPEAAEAAERALLTARTDPWIDRGLIDQTLRAIGARSRDFPVDRQRRLATVLAEPFAVERERVHRIATGLEVASHVDPRFCVDYIDRMGPMPLEEAFLKTTARCFRAADDPRAASAVADLDAYLALSPVFGAGLADPAPTALAPAAAPAPSATTSTSADQP